MVDIISQENQPMTQRDFAVPQPVPTWWQKYRWVVKSVVLSLCAIVTIVSLSIWSLWEAPLSSPVNSQTIFHFLEGEDGSDRYDRIVYGFLPYWNINKVTIQPELTHLAYFSLGIGGDGKIILTQDGNAEPGYNKLQSDEFNELSRQMIQNKGQVEIVLTLFDPDAASQFLPSERAHQNLIEALDSLLISYPISGVNIDIEINSSDPAIRKGLTQFVKTLREHLDERYSKITLSIDMYASASNNKQIWDLPELNNYIDYFVVMAYDFHRTSSMQAGPVAPLFGGEDLWSTDVTSHLREFLTYLPSEKILLGVPFYGYEWQTTSTDAQSHTFPETGRTASIARVQELIKESDPAMEVTEHWNEDALSPYLSYKDDDKLFVIYYENSRSISYKIDLVNQLDLAGIAIWAVGYEGDSRELWDVVRQKITTPK